MNTMLGGGAARPTEHEEIRWVTGSELLELPLAPADRAFAERLVADVASD